MTLETLYPGIANSPVTVLTSGISTSATSIPVQALECFPTAPNIAVVGGCYGDPGNGEYAVTYTYTGKDASSGPGNLTGCTVVEGTDRAWASGVSVSRPFTNKDWSDLVTNAAQWALATDLTGMLEYKGVLDCSTNPNYPSASKGDSYIVSVAGKVGGASGTAVEVGDMILANADTAGGTEASVGGSWDILQSNLVGAVVTASTLEQGDILYYSGSAWLTLPHGTDGQFLKTQGNGANPVWADATGSGSVATDAIWDAAGDLAVGTGSNTAGRLAVGSAGQYLKVAAGGTSLEWGTLSAGGDVVGPESSTDNTIARFDGTNNKTIQGSLVTIDDSGSINIPSGQSYKVNGTALAASDVGAATTSTKLDDFAAPDDNTDLNASTTAHGLLVKATAPAAGLRNVVGIDNGESAYTNKALFDAIDPAMNGSASPGSAMTAARRDHVHASDTSRAPANPLATDSLWDAAGDLAVGTGANTASRLAKGTAYQVLRMKSDASTVEWGAAANAATVQTSTISILTSANDDGSPLNALDIGCNIGIIRRIRIWGTQTLGQRTEGTFLINDGDGISPTDTSLAYDGLVGTLPTAGNEATGDYIWIDNELCRVSAGTSTPLTIVRGLCGTVGAFHDDNAICRTANEGLRLKLFSGNAESEDNLFFDWRRIYTGVWTTDAAISAGDKVLTLGSSPAVLPDFGLGDFIGIDDGTIEKVPVQAVYGSVAGTTYDDSIATLYALGAHDTSKTVYRLCQWDGAIPFKLDGTATNLYISIYPEQLLPGSIDIIVQFLIEKMG